MKKFITLYFVLLAFSTCLAQTSTTTISASCGKCYKKVAASSKVGDYCPHCGVRWGYENTSTTKSTVSNSGTSLYKVPSSGSLQSSNNVKKPNSQIQQQESTASKAETEKWLLSKLNAYSIERTTSSEKIGFYSITESRYNRYTYKYSDFVFEDYYLSCTELFESDGNISRKIIKIPIFDFWSLVGFYNELSIVNHKQTILNTDVGNGKTIVSETVTIGFDQTAETDIKLRMEKAFNHLKKFYSKPPSKEPF